jgi:hypothetical protein
MPFLIKDWAFTTKNRKVLKIQALQYREAGVDEGAKRFG